MLIWRSIGLILILSLFFVAKSSLRDKSWSAKNVKEPNCLKCACMGDPIKQKYWPSILKILEHKLYMPMKSKSSCLFSHVVQTGREVRSDSDVDTLCLSDIFDLKSGLKIDSQIDGSNVTSRFSLKRAAEINLYDVEQRFDPLEMSKSHAANYMSLTSPKHLSITWTDGTSLLGTSCRWDGQTAWFVYSKRKALSNRGKTRILKKFIAMRFDPEKAYTANYDKCD